jgi:hypothetical protein
MLQNLSFKLAKLVLTQAKPIVALPSQNVKLALSGACLGLPREYNHSSTLHGV